MRAAQDAKLDQDDMKTKFVKPDIRVGFIPGGNTMEINNIYPYKFPFRIDRHSLDVPAWQHRPSHGCSPHCAWGQAGRGRGVHPLRGETGEVRHDHVVLWILWRSHEAFRKVASHDYWTGKKSDHI